MYATIIQAAVKWAILMQVSPSLVLGVIETESRFQTGAQGKIQEIGLMQVRPEYSPIKGPALFIPEVNTLVGVVKLKDCISKFKKEARALVCYNSGRQKAFTIDSSSYSDKVLKARKKYRKWDSK